ncbi:MAG TPA: T9SS type A sorting domain-containing protein, partial [Puia sp.]|nr:T9SS type A sorting domain-containing protein [Puia sp.]
MWVKDTLAAVGLAPKRELAVYPNPVRRGAAMSLNWQRTEPGTYEVALFSATGALVERRIVEVGSKEQVDLFGLPPALPAGMYFLRAARPGGAKVITLKLIVL